MLRPRPFLTRRGFASAAGLALPALAAGAWPEFRGSGGQGHGPSEALPTSWSDTKNVTWKAPLPGLGWSTPVILDREIWLTTAQEDGRWLGVVAVDFETGELLREVEVFRNDSARSIHKKNSQASPSAVVSEDRVYVHFGARGTAALTHSGEIVWTATEFAYREPHGPGGSPVLWDGRLYFNCDGNDRHYVVALDAATGKTRWRADRPHGNMAFATPLVVEMPDGTAQLISPGADLAYAYSAVTGEPLWHIRYSGFSNIPRPVYAHGLVYIATGFHGPSMLAVRPGGRGDVTDSHIVWETSRGVPLTPSPVVVGDEFYMVSDRGILSCLDAKTGKQHYQARLGGNFSASPIYAGGLLYFQNEDGGGIVVRPGTEFKKVASNQVPGRTLASPSVHRRALLIRTDSALYRIG